MKNLPEKIFLVIDTDGEEVEDFKEMSGVSWCADRINDTDVEYALSKSESKWRKYPEEKPTKKGYYPVRFDGEADPSIWHRRFYDGKFWCNDSIVAFYEIPPFTENQKT